MAPDGTQSNNNIAMGDAGENVIDNGGHYQAFNSEDDEVDSDEETFVEIIEESIRHIEVVEESNRNMAISYTYRTVYSDNDSSSEDDDDEDDDQSETTLEIFQGNYEELVDENVDSFVMEHEIEHEEQQQEEEEEEEEVEDLFADQHDESGEMLATAAQTLSLRPPQSPSSRSAASNSGSLPLKDSPPQKPRSSRGSDDSEDGEEQPSSIRSPRQPNSTRSSKSENSSSARQRQPNSSRSSRSTRSSKSESSSSRRSSQHQKRSSIIASPNKSKRPSYKIPALHTNKQEGDDHYIQRQIDDAHSNSNDSSSSNHNGRNQPITSPSTNRRKSGSSNKNGRARSSSSSLERSPIGRSERSSGSKSVGSKNSRNSNTQRSRKTNQSSRSQDSPRRTSTSTNSPRRTSTSSIPSSVSAHSTITSYNQFSNTHSNFDGAKRVSWKSDPKASFSDWTLEVIYRDSDNKRHIDVYHVHRNVVGFGHRKSNYLLRDIMEAELAELIDSSNETEVELQMVINSTNNDNGNNGNNNNKTNGNNKRSMPKSKFNNTFITRLKLPNEAQALSVPMVLDFMYYTNETKQRMSADRSCNVFKVAEGLEVEALQKAIGEFYMKNLSLKNLGEFLTAATKVKADKLLTICKAKIGQMITLRSELANMVPPKFMAEILFQSSQQLQRAREMNPDKVSHALLVHQSRYWSKAAMMCASKNESILTPKLFENLTCEESLPYIDVSATPRLLAMESVFLQQRSQNKNKKSTDENHLTSLQRRCVEAIGEDFDAFQECFDSHQEIAESLKHLPSNILSEILMKLLTKPE